MQFVTNPLTWLMGRYRVRLLLRAAGRAREAVRYAFVLPRLRYHFHIVSAQRNAGHRVLRCLDSVEGQNYPKDLCRHLVIDDASDDGTPDLIEAWLARHSDHNVELIQRRNRRGGTSNTLEGIRHGGSESIVIELNGDDWLPDPGVLSFINKVYEDPEVWMTYNTQRESTGVIPFQLPPPRKVRRTRAYRGLPWATSHLHTFRRPLFDHVPEEVMVDPETGEYWESADDVALYLYMLELAGEHARHLWRITCLYHFHEQTEYRLDREGQLEREMRIRTGRKAEALDAI